MPDRGEVTRILSRLSDGDALAFDELLPFVYAELRILAERYMRGERQEHTLQATALIHEAYLRLLDQPTLEWQGRAHFLGVAARAMRRILVEHARARKRKKRGGGWNRVTLDSLLAAPDAPQLDLMALDTAMTKLGDHDPRKSRVVELLYFGGLTAEEAGEVLGVTGRTVERDWRYARLWLLREILGSDQQGKANVDEPSTD